MSSSSSSVTTSTVNGTTRVTGLTSGIDVDSIVEQLMTAEKAKKLNKLEQKEQLAEWRQDSYQSVISDIQDFYNKYFNTTSSTSLLSAKNFKQYSVASSNSAVSAAATSTAGTGSHTVFVSKLATAATKSSSGLSPNVKGGQAVNYASLSGTSFAITLDGTEYTVSLSSNASSYSTAQTLIQTAVDTAVGSGKLTVSVDSSTGEMAITAAANSGVDVISVSAPDSGTSALTALGLTASGAVTTNRLDTSEATLADILDSSQFSTDSSGNKYVTFSINGESYTFYSTTVLDDMLDEINDSDCGATIAYDTTIGELVLTADSTGAGDLLAVGDTAGNFAATIFTASTAGTDAKFQIDGVTYTRSANTVLVNGVTYTLNAVTDTDGDGTADAGETATVSLTLDSGGIYDLIASFAEDYDSLIATINDLVDEDYDSDYLPLTDDQKKEMDDDEITAWEKKAKKGILENDSLLKSFLSDLRNALTDSIASVSTSIFDIGIDTGDYDENGKLVIDEDALKAAIAANPEAIMKLFTKQATSVSGSTGTYGSLSSSQLATRYKEEGIAYRFYDTIQEYISTSKNSSGSRGKLVEKAGLADSSIASDNYYNKLIDDYNGQISDEEDRLGKYEESLYNKYTALETYISNMNTQLSALSSYLNSSSS